jgi:hypothetical protein
LRLPTLAIFQFPNPTHYHDHHWVRCIVTDQSNAFDQLVQAAEELLAPYASATVTDSSSQLAFQRRGN